MRPIRICAAGTLVAALAFSAVAQRPLPAPGQAEPGFGEQPAERPDYLLKLPTELEAEYITGDELSTFRYSAGTFVPLKGFRKSFGETPPLPTRLALRLRFQQQFLDDDLAFDMPPELYRLETGLIALHQFNERWSLTALGTAGLHGDLDTMEDVYRFSAFAIADRKVNEKLTINFSFGYIDREEFSFVLAPGVDWRPNDDWRVLVRPPDARVSRRLAGESGPYGTFAYASAGLSGGSYAVERADGSEDILTIRGFPLRLGLEKVYRNGRLFGDAGWMFGRKVEYEDGDEDEHLDDGFVLRAGITF